MRDDVAPENWSFQLQEKIRELAAAGNALEKKFESCRMWDYTWFEPLRAVKSLHRDVCLLIPDPPSPASEDERDLPQPAHVLHGAGQCAGGPHDRTDKLHRSPYTTVHSTRL